MFILQICFNFIKVVKLKFITPFFKFTDSRLLLWLSVTCNESCHRHHRSISKLMIYVYITKHAVLFMFKGQSFYQRSSCL